MSVINESDRAKDLQVIRAVSIEHVQASQLTELLEQAIYWDEKNPQDFRVAIEKVAELIKALESDEYFLSIMKSIIVDPQYRAFRENMERNQLWHLQEKSHEIDLDLDAEFNYIRKRIFGIFIFIPRYFQQKILNLVGVSDTEG